MGYKDRNPRKDRSELLQEALDWIRAQGRAGVYDAHDAVQAALEAHSHMENVYRAQVSVPYRLAKKVLLQVC